MQARPRQGANLQCVAGDTPGGEGGARRKQQGAAQPEERRIYFHVHHETCARLLVA